MKHRLHTSIVLDTRSPKKDGSYPVKLRITYYRKQKYFPVSIFLMKKEWQDIIEGKARGHLKKIRLIINAKEAKANDIIENMSSFSFEKFRNKFYGVSISSVYEYYEKKIKILEEEGKYSSVNIYTSSMNSLKSFAGNTLKFEDVTPSFLKKYEHKKKQKNGRTTIGIYIRCLRVVFNDAIREGLINKENYPFGKGKYMILPSKNIKKAISIENIEKIYNYIPSNLGAERAKELWLFSYCASGMNVVDMLRLKKNNVIGDTIVFHRKKTENSSPIAIVVPINDYVRKIIDKYECNDTQYIFPYFNDKMTDKDKYRIKNNCVVFINRWMKVICKEIGIDAVTTYTARHTFATLLKRNGASTELIKESLGHSSVDTTEKYLGSFDSKVKAEFAKKLLDFKANQDNH